MVVSTSCPQRITSYSAPSYSIIGITGGPDGQLWFTDYGLPSINTMDVSGALTASYLLPVSDTPWGITAGPDGNIWFGDAIEGTGGLAGAVGMVCLVISPPQCPSKNFINRYTLDPNITGANEITPGPDGAMWFTAHTTDFTSFIGRMTTDGKNIKYYAVGLNGAEGLRPVRTALSGLGRVGQSVRLYRQLAEMPLTSHRRFRDRRRWQTSNGQASSMQSSRGSRKSGRRCRIKFYKRFSSTRATTASSSAREPTASCTCTLGIIGAPAAHKLATALQAFKTS